MWEKKNLNLLVSGYISGPKLLKILTTLRLNLILCVHCISAPKFIVTISLDVQMKNLNQMHWTCCLGDDMQSCIVMLYHENIKEPLVSRELIVSSTDEAFHLELNVTEAPILGPICGFPLSLASSASLEPTSWVSYGISISLWIWDFTHLIVSSNLNSSGAFLHLSWVPPFGACHRLIVQWDSLSSCSMFQLIKPCVDVFVRNINWQIIIVKLPL